MFVAWLTQWLPPASPAVIAVLRRVAVVCRAVAVSYSSERERERERERAARSLAIVVLGFKCGHRRLTFGGLWEPPNFLHQPLGSYSSVFRVHQMSFLRSVSEGWVFSSAEVRASWRLLSPPSPSALANQLPTTFPATGTSLESRGCTVFDSLLGGQASGGVGLDVLNCCEPFPPLVGVLLFHFHQFLVVNPL
ncbi:LOW QUALITY PROTEIN: hypothetical protein Cgig2_025749 [Carnegiea gigantea]|uniref:Uncharacterized protein n=1 Tax=Carnegiea gigantea TaxID=171969 RepID=A0A9Q1JGX8_9CARY|nr:LOW QUALITY PROTEIN: hypothetical protein Cgig2_025749 [Carnegiea gigantea]